MEYKLNSFTNEYDVAKTGQDLYNTNQMCNRCDNYIKKKCSGKQTGLYKLCVNEFCPKFKDRNYTDEQHNLKTLSDLINELTK